MVEKKRIQQDNKPKVEELLMKLLKDNEELRQRLDEVSTKTGRKKNEKPVKEKKFIPVRYKPEGSGTEFYTVEKPMNITRAMVDDFLKKDMYFKTKNGNRAKIFWVNKNNPHKPVMGMVELEKDVWDVRVWNYDGGVRAPHYHGHNLVGIWED